MPYHSGELVEVVAQLGRQLGAMQAEISGLRADLRQFGLRADADADADAETLIEAIRAAMNDVTFLAAGLLARSLRPDAPGARLAALIAWRSVRSLGKTLARAANKRTDSGLVLRQIGATGAGLLWHVGV